MNIHSLTSFSSDTSCFLESARFSSVDWREFNPSSCVPEPSPCSVFPEWEEFYLQESDLHFMGGTFQLWMTRILKVSFKFCLNSCLSLSCFPLRLQPGMETPLDVLSRAASLVHADDEKRKWGIYVTRFLLCPLVSCPITDLHVFWLGFVAICC